MIDPEVQERIDLLDKYEFDDDISTFHSIHLYKKELAYPDGFYDSYFFEVIGYNETVGKRKNLGKHDGIALTESAHVDNILLYADDSVYIGFRELVFVSSPYQAIEFSKYVEENKHE
jgi:hypothetical protein